jgi:hypothetical protein
LQTINSIAIEKWLNHFIFGFMMIKIFSAS